MAGEGKSTLVANLASAIAQCDCKVIVVDANLHRPVLHEVFQVANDTGLSSLLQHTATLDAALQPSRIAGVQVIASGPLPPNPAELLDAPPIAALIEELKRRADHILIDTPAVETAMDAIVLAPRVEGVLLIVNRSQAHQETVQAARRQLLAVHAPLVGAVVNRAERMWSH
jgi:capsular exopolysaccharide synthesis family protein